MIYNTITGKLNGRNVMSSNLTHDSGIHTMSSRRDSDIGDSVLPHGIGPAQFHSRKTSSDYTPPIQNTARRLAHSLDHVTNAFQNCDLAHYSNNNSMNNAGDHRCSYQSNNSGCHSHNFEQRSGRCCDSRHESLRQRSDCHGSSRCSNGAGSAVPSNRYQPSDPGGMVLSGLAPSNSCSPIGSRCCGNADRGGSACCAAQRSSRTNSCSDGRGVGAECQGDGGVASRSSPLRTQEKILRTNRPTPLSTARLQPTRHQTKNAILSILEDGEVTVEFIKKRGPLKRDTICEVMRISPDGLRIVIYEPQGNGSGGGGGGTSPSASPAPLPKHGADYIYSVENLPEKHWRKYVYAFKFVDLVKAKTPKVTYYSDKAKCLLMENLTDFEVHFHDGGKVVNSSAEGVVITDVSGNKYNFKRLEECDSLSGTLEFMWKQAVKSQKHCALLEETLSRLPGTNFPIIVGRRPISMSNREKENSPIVAPSFAISINTTNTTNAANDFTSTASSRLKEKQVTVPGVGVATQLPNGEVKVRYADGTQMWVDGKNQIKYQNTNGLMSRFTENDKVPRNIMEKLQHMPKVLKCLMSSEGGRKTHSFR